LNVGVRSLQAARAERYLMPVSERKSDVHHYVTGYEWEINRHISVLGAGVGVTLDDSHTVCFEALSRSLALISSSASS